LGGVENAVKQFCRVLYVVGKQHRGKLMPSIKTKIEEEHGRKLTNRQMSFAKFFVDGVYSNAECARKAGYAEDVAAKQASILLNGRDYPHVLEYVTELREERERRYGVTMVGQLERLHKLSHAAEDAGSFSAAINAEKIRSALGGLTVDRREQVNTIDALSRDEIVARLADMQRKYPQAFQIEGTMKDVTNVKGPRGELLEPDQGELAQEIFGDKD
jgi:phage terminase small subunit